MFRRTHLTAASFVLALVLQAALAADGAPLPQNEIEALLRDVGTSGCVFIRNDTEHSSVEAEEHLRLKYRNAGKRVTTAEQFIDRLASRSSWSGKPYSVTCDGQATRNSTDWLNELLNNIRSGN